MTDYGPPQGATQRFIFEALCFEQSNQLPRPWEQKPFFVSMRSWKAGSMDASRSKVFVDSAPGLASFASGNCKRFGKKHVVLLVDVLVHVSFELRQAVVESPEGVAGPIRRCEVIRQRPKFFQCCA